MITYNKRNARIWSMLGERRTVGVALNEIANVDDTFTFITADVGRYNQMDRFIKNHPDKYINVGIAEQNMIGVAAGMAKEGFNVFASSYATFITARVLDQVRTCLGVMELPVTLIGGGGGFSEGALGATHMGLEDIANMRGIPGMTVVSPADATETMKVLEAASTYGKPLYVRLTGYINMPIVYSEDYDFEIGKAVKLREGEDIAIIASGASVYESLIAAESLKEDGICCDVYDMHTIKPIDEDTLLALSNYKYVICVEEHSIIGGLGTAVAEYYAEKDHKCKVIRIGVDDVYPIAGYYGDLLDDAGLTSEKLYDRIKKIVK